MRKICDSCRTESSWWFSSSASLSRVPNGFSITTRTSASGCLWSLCSPSCFTISAKKFGAVER